MFSISTGSYKFSGKMSAGQRRQGVPVVKVSQKKGQRYEVDEEALASVLLRPEIRNLPVVVVSVAGAYRGGKSFILDFFLRYLTASRSSQLSSEWLGREDQVLEGFDWRGGSVANTKGIHLWPEPFPVTNEQTGEKFVVLLMDTQGTFDTESDAGDNSTIFALSTLLSSVQIYNLRANIGEDDLQHLQLFTEYGKLACGAEGKAFQTLKFLVRDWMCPYEHPHGYAGGEALLKRILAPNLTQKKQLREVREHIYSCFEKLQCFLMPHPGLVVADKFFKGRLCDINANFRMSLLELIPSIFEPENLTPKIINGDKVEAQSLLDYFKQYVDIFNKDDLPEATTIYQATAKACMMSALREARSHYESKMESNIIEDQSVSTSMIQNWHNIAVTAATDHFNSKKKFSAQDTIDTHLKELQKELDARLALYRLQNDAKVRNTVSLAKKAYEECVSNVCDVQARLCLHERDLAALQQRATQQAFAVFDRTRTQVPQEKDGERINLIQDLEQHYQHLSAVNEQNNRSAMLEARNLYLTRMRDQITQAGVTPEMLESQHAKTMAEAVEHFHSYRNQRTEEPEDIDVNQLEQDIEECFVEIEKNNINSNMFAMQMAESTYNTYVTSAWSPQSYCFHPKGLAELHKAARKRAFEQFLNERIESEQDIFKEKLITKLDARYEELKVNNTYNNRQAVEQALSEYRRLMDGLKLSQTNFIVAIIRKLFRWTNKRHDAARKSALQVFAARRIGGNYNDDEYLTDLKEGIERAYGDYNVW